MFRTLDKVDRRRPSLYCILFGFVTFVRLRSRGPAQRFGQAEAARKPRGSRAEAAAPLSGAAPRLCGRFLWAFVKAAGTKASV